MLPQTVPPSEQVLAVMHMGEERVWHSWLPVVQQTLVPMLAQLNLPVPQASTALQVMETLSQVCVALSQQLGPQAVWPVEQGDLGLQVLVALSQTWVALSQQLEPQTIWPEAQPLALQVLLEVSQVCVASLQQLEPQAVWPVEQVVLATQVAVAASHFWVALSQQTPPQAVWVAVQVGGLGTQAPEEQFSVSVLQQLEPHGVLPESQVAFWMQTPERQVSVAV